MKRGFIMAWLFVSLAYGANVYERNCVPCHQNLPTSLEQMFKNYLLVYSSERFVKVGIKLK